MKLSVNGKQIALAVDTTISIERLSPLLNEDTGTYSFPFPVPTLPNQQHLGWPGKLQRTKGIDVQSFELEDDGVLMLGGEIDYDEITALETGLILQSGSTEFNKRMEGKMLGELDYGSEWWPGGSLEAVYVPSIDDKLAAWDLANTTDNGKYVLTPFIITDMGVPSAVNRQDWSAPGQTHLRLGWWEREVLINDEVAWGAFCLQFKVSFILRTIFESQGYTINENDFWNSEFNKAILFGKIMSIELKGLSKLSLEFNPLHLSVLMPDVKIPDFLAAIKNMFGLVYEINDRRKEVRILFKKNVFLPENLSNITMTELTGWKHKEVKATNGFALNYSSQDDEPATYTEWPEWVNVVSELPAPTTENEIVLGPASRYYIAVKDESDVLHWKEVGRLRATVTGAGENAVEIKARVPEQSTYITHSITLECPNIPKLNSGRVQHIYPGSFLINVPLTITLYHGRKSFGVVSYPYASFDHYSLDRSIDTGISLKPSYLYSTVYSEFLNWQTYRAKEFTKNIEISLTDLVALQWGKRYMIGGIQVILNKINYDLPYEGRAEVNGFTV